MLDARKQVPDADRGAAAQGREQTTVYSDRGGHFTIVGMTDFDAWQCLAMDAYSAAMAFVQHKFDVHGDILQAIRCFSRQRHSALRNLIFSAWAHLEHLRIASLHGLRRPAARNIQFHYDRSNEFYSQFLDSRMVYSAAYFENPEEPLEDAQCHELELICRDLGLRASDRFLDIGCGWGGLIT